MQWVQTKSGRCGDNFNFSEFGKVFRDPLKSEVEIPIVVGIRSGRGHSRVNVVLNC